jgi:hypothetical protein
VIRHLLPLLLSAALVPTAQAGPKLRRAFLVAACAASAADAISSRGLSETNPLLASQHRLSWQKATIWKGAMCAGLVAVQEWDVRRRPGHTDAWAGANVAAIVPPAVAVWRNGRK